VIDRQTIGVSLLVVALVLFAQGRGWIPTPQPGPGPSPVDPVEPQTRSPFGDDKFRVMLVVDPNATLPRQQSLVVGAKGWQEYVASKGGQWRVLGPEAEFTLGTGEPWKSALARPRASMPWLVIGSASGGAEQPLPADPDRMLEVCRQWGEQ
jgi:hypothetical protein